jgi:hypothetical protein
MEKGKNDLPQTVADKRYFSEKMKGKLKVRISDPSPPVPGFLLNAGASPCPPFDRACRNNISF